MFSVGFAYSPGLWSCIFCCPCSLLMAHFSAAAQCVRPQLLLRPMLSQLPSHKSISLLFAGSFKVIVTLLVVGVMDHARADVLADGNVSLSLIELLSQVCSETYKEHAFCQTSGATFRLHLHALDSCRHAHVSPASAICFFTHA